MYRTRCAFLSMLAMTCLACGMAASSGWARQLGFPEIVVDGDPILLAGVGSDYSHHSPTLSPDGSKIAFDYGSNIYVMNDDGTNIINLTPNPRSYGSSPSWSPDGSKIAFNGTTSSSTLSRIHVMNANGTNLINLSQYEPLGYLAWSPDSSKIAFTCEKGTYPGLAFSPKRLEICVINPDGTNFVRLTHNSVRDAYPVWSPDGSKIAFTCSIAIAPQLANREICVINPDGTNFVRLTHNSVRDAYPVWSPDGSKIVFESRSVLDYRISYIVNADGTNPLRVRLTETLELFYGDTREADGILAKNPKLFDVNRFRWSPDGSKIVFQTTAPRDDVYHVDSRIGYRTFMNADGTNSRIWSPSLSSSNSYIVMNADGTNPFHLDAPLLPFYTHQGDWSSDGSTVVAIEHCPYTVCGKLSDLFRLSVYKLRYRRRGSLQATLLNLSPWQAWVHLSCLQDTACLGTHQPPCAVAFECNGFSGEPVAWSVTVEPNTIFRYWPANFHGALRYAGKTEEEARRRTTCEVFSPHPLAVRGYTRFNGQPTLVPVTQPGEPRRRVTLSNLSPSQAWVHLYCLKDRAGPGADSPAPCAVTFECNGFSGEPVTWPVAVAPKTIFSYWPNKTVDGRPANFHAALMTAGKTEEEARRRTTCEVSSADPIAVRGYTRFGGEPTLVPVTAY